MTTYLSSLRSLFTRLARIFHTRRCSLGYEISGLAGRGITAAFLTGLPAMACAQSLYIPNGSFEAPETDLASPSINGWEKAPEPFWYVDSTGMFPWPALMGQFANPTNGASDHIDNIDGRQGAYLFALPDVAIFQDNNTIDETNTTPSREFNAQFEAGKSYTLTVGVLGGGGGMSNGVPLVLSLYYRDAASNMVTVGATTVTNSKSLFPTNTHLTDFQVRVPFVKATDAWAGKRIGIKLASGLTLLDSALFGGYWDIDHVRLTESVVRNGSFESPETDFASPSIDGWMKAPEPLWYVDPTGMFPWSAVMGQYLNSSNGSPDHITNMDGRQGAYLFALPEVAIFQDDNFVAGTDAELAPEPGARFEVGKSYALTVGVLGGGGGMSNGVTFDLSLYYRDAASNAVTVASTTITNSTALFPTNTYFTDFQVRVPQVKAGDAWVGKNIGIKLASGLTLLDSERFGGYWDIDHVRLTESVLPNHSFEYPETDFAGPTIGGWQKAPEPFWYVDPTGMFPWPAVMGQFLNTTNGAPDHIDNVDGRQAAYLFALPDVAIFQDYLSVGGTNAEPTHEFSLKYERGHSYNLTVGVLGGGGGMSNGVPLVISFYYRDASSNRVTVSSTTITNSKAWFPANSRLIDFQVQVPTVRGDEPWVGQYVGLQVASGLTLRDAALFGGYWDVDNVRLRVIRDPVLKDATVNARRDFQFTLSSAPGRYEILSSADVGSPLSNWESVGVVTNLTGEVAIVDPTNGHRFYRIRPSP